jgi:hypothetical protein
MVHVRTYRGVKYLANYGAAVFMPVKALPPMRSIKMYDTEWSMHEAIDASLKPKRNDVKRFSALQLNGELSD